MIKDIAIAVAALGILALALLSLGALLVGVARRYDSTADLSAITGEPVTMDDLTLEPYRLNAIAALGPEED